MRIIPSLAIIAVLAPAATVAAQGRQPQNPYANLFSGQLNGAPTPRTPPSPPPQLVPLPAMPPLSSLPAQTVVCGMTVVQGDSKLDSAMPHHPPANAPKPSIKIVPAPACQK
jgi:hypothetical protein